MFCPKCGSDNPNDARFCGHCGGAMTTPASVPRKPGSEVTRLLDLNEPALTVAPGLKWGILAASLLLPIVGIVMGLVYWIKGESDDKAAVGRLWFFVSLVLALLYGLMAS